MKKDWSQYKKDQTNPITYQEYKVTLSLNVSKNQKLMVELIVGCFLFTNIGF